MPEDERFEDYVELENYIEALQAGKVVQPPTNLTPEQARIYQMAALFRAGTDNNAEPDPEFVERLKGQLLEAKEQPQVIQAKPELKSTQTRTVPPPIETEAEKPSIPARGNIKRAHFFSRRSLLTGGALAAASLVVGAGIGYEEHQSQPPTSHSGYPPPASQNLYIAEGTPTTWYFVTSLADLGNEAVRFTSDTIVGYVLRTPKTATDTSNNAESVIALSAACTHMGCLVQWKSTERHFACPCHGALFAMQGAQLTTDYQYTLPPLPTLNTKIEDGNVYVEVPR